jgi:2-phospho-L-lactate transferase/gluconeogenesis factor (CofD/UPF0052 family)
MNLEPNTEETRGLDHADHLRVLLDHAPELVVHTVLADASAAGDLRLAAAVEAAGARLVLTDLASDTPGVHDPVKLGTAYAQLTGAN